jgi:hypothetical protein
VGSWLELLEILETSLPSNAVEGAVSWRLVETATSDGVLSFTYVAGTAIGEFRVIRRRLG